MSMTLDEQLADFSSLGAVFDPTGSEQAVADELAELLMRQPLAAGPLARIAGLNRLLRVLRLASRTVTARRDREADALTAVWPYRRIAALLGVNSSTMQGWANEGRKAREVVDTQDVSRGTTEAGCAA